VRDGQCRLCGNDCPKVVAELEAEIRSLNSDDKTGLIRALLAGPDGPCDAEVEPAWIEGAQGDVGRLFTARFSQFPATVSSRAFARARTDEA
jgi:hypothetical protein